MPKGFDWNQFEKVDTKKADSGFDWNQFEKAPESKGALEDISGGLGRWVKAASANLSDELAGGVEAGGAMLGLKGLGGKLKDIGLSEAGPTIDPEVLKSAYREGKQRELANLAEFERENPKMAFALDLAGSLTSPLNKLIPAGTGAFKTGAAIGGANALGLSEADSPSGLAKDVGIGALTGGGFGWGADKALSGLAGRLQSLANRKAFKSLGPYQRDAMKAMGRDNAEKIGQTLLDKGAIGWVPKSYEKLGQKAASLADDAGEELGKYMQKLSEAESKLGAKGSSLSNFKFGIDRKAIANALRKDLISTETDIPGAVARNENIKRLITQFEKGGDDLLKILEAETKKRAAGETINWNRPPGADIPTLEEEVNRSLYTKLKTGVEQYADALDQLVGGAGSKVFKELKDKFGNLTEAAKIAGTRGAKESANRMISPSDYGVGTAGTIIGTMMGGPMGALAGPALGLANNLGRKYGNQIVAKTADTVAKQLSRIPDYMALSTSNPQAFQQIVYELTSKQLLESSPLQRRANELQNRGQ